MLFGSSKVNSKEILKSLENKNSYGEFGPKSPLLNLTSNPLNEIAMKQNWFIHNNKKLLFYWKKNKHENNLGETTL